MVSRPRVRTLCLSRRSTRRPMRLDQPGASRQQHFVDANDFTRRLANPSCQIENPYAVCFAPALELAAVYEVLWCKGKLGREIGEDVTETLELIPRQWKVIQHVREKFSCRACEAITQPPAPSHPIARGRAARSFSLISSSPSTACI